MRIVQTEPVSIGVADPKDKIRDLVLWSVSDEYFALRDTSVCRSVRDSRKRSR